MFSSLPLLFFVHTELLAHTFQNPSCDRDCTAMLLPSEKLRFFPKYFFSASLTHAHNTQESLYFTHFLFANGHFFEFSEFFPKALQCKSECNSHRNPSLTKKKYSEPTGQPLPLEALPTFIYCISYQVTSNWLHLELPTCPRSLP